jgi:dihydropteroate synthase
VVADVSAFLIDRAARAEAAGVPRDRIVLDAGLDLGKTWQQSLELLRRSDVLAGLGYPLLLSASNKTFLGKLLDLEIDQRADASAAATAIGVMRGCRVVRAHDVRATRAVCDVLAALTETAA